MSTMLQETGNLPASNNSPSPTPWIDERVHRGADAIADMAHKTAAQLDKAKEYLWMQGGKLKQQGTNLTATARQHPVYTLATVGLIGFGIGFAVRGWRAK